MTLEEKRAKIKETCSNVYEEHCPSCPLYGVKESCFSEDKYIDRNYAVMFGYVFKDDESNIAEDDPVNHPSHYTNGGIECLDAMAASMTKLEFMGYLKGAIIKYVWRYRLKGKPVEDLKKARFYLDKLIEYAEKESVSI